eukprot:10238703-Alexandrium_andersonii.AAC.1
MSLGAIEFAPIPITILFTATPGVRLRSFSAVRSGPSHSGPPCPTLAPSDEGSLSARVGSKPTPCA